MAVMPNEEWMRECMRSWVAAGVAWMRQWREDHPEEAAKQDAEWERAFTKAADR